MKWVLAYIGIDLGFNFVVKVLRGDFWWWAAVAGWAKLVVSVIKRVFMKVIAYFTSIVQFRHPYEVGGDLLDIWFRVDNGRSYYCYCDLWGTRW